MGNCRFRISDMIPNAWFYKFNDMKKTHLPSFMIKKQQSYPKSTTQQQKSLKPGRASYYIPSTIGTSSTNTIEDKFPNSPVNVKASDTKFLTDPPGKSKKIRPGGGRNSNVKPCDRVLTSSVSFGCGCRSTLKTMWKGGEFPLPNPPLVPESRVSGGSNINDDDDDGLLPCLEDKPVISSLSITSSPTDINNGRQDFPSVPPPILTKPISKKQHRESNEPSRLEDFKSSPRRRKSSAGIHRLKTRANSPRLTTNKRTTTRSRKSKGLLSESFVVVKTSSDPQRDFGDSMMEMIVENRMTAVKDLEELLACYLSLNSDEYHDVIVKVFEQIWFYLMDHVNLR